MNLKIPTRPTLALLAIIPLTLPAETRPWSNAGNSKNWDTTNAAAWGGAPWKNQNADVALFGGPGREIMVTSPITCGGIVFEGAGYRLTGGPIMLTGNAPFIRVKKSITSTINCGIGHDRMLVKEGEGTLVISSATPQSLPEKVLVNEGRLVFTAGVWDGYRMKNKGTLVINPGAEVEFAAGHSIGGSNRIAPQEIIIKGGTLTMPETSHLQYFHRLTLNNARIKGKGVLRTMDNDQATIVVEGQEPSILSLTKINGAVGANASLIADVAKTGATQPDLTLDAIINEYGPAHTLRFAKTGPGTILLPKSNTHRGGTEILDGTVIATNLNSLGSDKNPVTLTNGTLESKQPNLSVGDFTMKGGTLDLNGASQGTLTLAPDKKLLIQGGTWRPSLGSEGCDTIATSGESTYDISSLVIDLSGTPELVEAETPLLQGFKSGTLTGVEIRGYDADKWTITISPEGVLKIAHKSAMAAIGGVLAALAALAGIIVFIIRRQKNGGDKATTKPAAAAPMHRPAPPPVAPHRISPPPPPPPPPRP